MPRVSLLLARMPDPSALVSDQPMCFNIAAVESRLPLRCDNSWSSGFDQTAARQDRLHVGLPLRPNLVIDC